MIIRDRKGGGAPAGPSARYQSQSLILTCRVVRRLPAGRFCSPLARSAIHPCHTHLPNWRMGHSSDCLDSVAGDI